MKEIKTNAMRILDKQKLAYQVLSYPHHDKEAVDGVSVAAMLNEDPAHVYKTLITQASSKAYYVFVIPVAAELDLKKAAKAVNEKAVELIPVKNLLGVSGYIRGGCSPDWDEEVVSDDSSSNRFGTGDDHLQRRSDRHAD